MPEVTIYTRDSSGVLADTPDLAVVLRVNGTDTPVTVSHADTGEYVATFDTPTEFAELIASSSARNDAQVVWRNTIDIDVKVESDPTYVTSNPVYST